MNIPSRLCADNIKTFPNDSKPDPRWPNLLLKSFIPRQPLAGLVTLDFDLVTKSLYEIVSPAVNELDAILCKLSRCFVEYMFEILFMDWS